MCLEDVRLGRKRVCAINTYSLGLGTEVVIAKAAKDRVLLRVSPFQDGFRVYPFDGEFPVNSGFYTAQEKPDFEITIEQHGDCVTKPWKATPAAVGGTITVMEVFLHDQ